MIDACWWIGLPVAPFPGEISLLCDAGTCRAAPSRQAHPRQGTGEVSIVPRYRAPFKEPPARVIVAQLNARDRIRTDTPFGTGS